ncbi:hypothetical protein AB0I55_00530 [Actinocatenispora sera]|uniref:hypothetical protein n=1 Tax=Actinocatenispora sera TaxID=390989 RepID=UPI0033D0DE86
MFAFGLELTSGALAVLHAVTTPGRVLEFAVLVAANLVATALRFVMLRGWVFGRPEPIRTAAPPAEAGEVPPRQTSVRPARPDGTERPLGADDVEEQA